MRISSTYAKTPEVTDIFRLNPEEQDAAIDEGEFILFHDGEKVKAGRGVNSLVTTIASKGDAYKKIKIVEAMDMINYDLTMTIQDSYIGKYENSYDNKQCLVVAIKGYFEGLERDKICKKDSSAVAVDSEAQRLYLTQHGIDTEDMTADEIKQADTGSFVFLGAATKILDAIEDVKIDIAI